MKKAINFILILLFVLLTVACGEQNKPITPVKYIDTGVDSEAWVTVPAGEFLKTQHRHKVMIDKPYEIMVTDVTNAQYVRFLNEALAKGAIKVQADTICGYYKGDPFDGWKHEFKVPAGDKLYMDLSEPCVHIKFDGKTFSVIKGYENHPVTCVTWFGANAYAKFYGWRLPSENEWEKAARGTDGRSLPWGEEISCEYTNYIACKHMVEKLYDGVDAVTTPVGFFNGKTYNGVETKNAKSPYGLYDMAGNVWQWCGDDYPNMHYRWYRGGSRDSYEINLFSWRRMSTEPQDYSMYIGFRCARDVQPKEVENAETENTEETIDK